MIEFDWHLTDVCNFECEYCHPQIARRKNKTLPHTYSAKQIADRFNDLDEKILLSMSGGEPFLFPNFVDFCYEITENGNIISINTNLSHNELIKDFAERINPKKVKGIYAAMHIQERERKGIPIEEFVDNVLSLQKKGFNTIVFYVLYPPLLNRFKRDLDKLVDSGVLNIQAKLFKGVYNRKIYPDSYTKEEKNRIISYKNNTYPLTMDYLGGLATSFLGKKCLAGVNSFKVEVNGEVYRCAGVKKSYGNLYKNTFKKDSEPQPCPRKRVLSLSWCKKNIYE